MHSKNNFPYESEYNYFSDLKDNRDEDNKDETYSDNEKSVF
ncbi:MAG: hypothetical protein Q7R87_04480 [Nanoarchaeota archaeon]|nr:hypothetical protein [Nanoarchaeota archaeon]